jgi:uncharacterized membrane protein YeaQ/YmgE (transglycosylase-associated protein family)
MNALMWFLAAGAAGWVTCSVLNLSALRGLVVAAILGSTGTFFGGDVFASLLVIPAAITPFALLIAAVGAIAGLKIAEIVYRRLQSDRQRLTPREPALP